MSIIAADLMQQAIKPTLEYLGIHSPAAEKLLLGTAAQASGFDPFCRSNKGIGIYQITSEQHRSIWDGYLAFIPDLASKVRGLASQHQFLNNPDQELAVNLSYSTAIAWIIYLRSDHLLPAADDADGLGLFWKNHFSHPQKRPSNQKKFARWIRDHCTAA